MTIDEAIKRLQGELRFAEKTGRLELYDALSLSIEALKEVKKARQGDPALDGELLPGET